MEAIKEEIEVIDKDNVVIIKPTVMKRVILLDPHNQNSKLIPIIRGQKRAKKAYRKKVYRRKSYQKRPYRSKYRKTYRKKIYRKGRYF